jgi:CheY-like chemotaxis protein
MTTKILIVDDSKLARMSVAKLLSGLRPGWTRLEAAGAEEALALADQEHPDIILLDFNMPGQSGLELAARLHQARPQIQVAIVSANIQVEIVERAGQAGAAFMAKPLTEAALGQFLDAAEAQLAAR